MPEIYIDELCAQCDVEEPDVVYMYMSYRNLALWRNNLLRERYPGYNYIGAGSDYHCMETD